MLPWHFPFLPWINRGIPDVGSEPLPRHFTLCLWRKRSAAPHGNSEGAAGLYCFYTLPQIHWSIFLTAALRPTQMYKLQHLTVSLPRTGTRKQTANPKVVGFDLKWSNIIGIFGLCHYLSYCSTSNLLGCITTLKSKRQRYLCWPSKYPKHQKPLIIHSDLLEMHTEGTCPLEKLELMF